MKPSNSHNRKSFNPAINGQNVEAAFTSQQYCLRVTISHRYRAHVSPAANKVTFDYSVRCVSQIYHVSLFHRRRTWRLPVYAFVDTIEET